MKFSFHRSLWKEARNFLWYSQEKLTEKHPDTIGNYCYYVIMLCIREKVSLGGLEKLSSNEKYSILKNHFKANKTYIFQNVHLHGCQSSCKIEYLTSSSVYSKKEDVVYCINCALVSPSDKRRTLGSFVNTGHTGWNNIHEK